jgi:hypothetical protein
MSYRVPIRIGIPKDWASIQFLAPSDILSFNPKYFPATIDVLSAQILAWRVQELAGTIEFSGSASFDLESDSSLTTWNSPIGYTDVSISVGAADPIGNFALDRTTNRGESDLAGYGLDYLGRDHAFGPNPGLQGGFFDFDLMATFTRVYPDITDGTRTRTLTDAGSFSFTFPTWPGSGDLNGNFSQGIPLTTPAFLFDPGPKLFYPYIDLHAIPPIGGLGFSQIDEWSGAAINMNLSFRPTLQSVSPSSSPPAGSIRITAIFTIGGGATSTFSFPMDFALQFAAPGNSTMGSWSPPTLGLMQTCSVEGESDQFYPYLTTDNKPVYDTASGAILNDPFS